MAGAAGSRTRKAAMEKLIIFLVIYFLVVNFVFPRLGLKPG